MSRMIRKQVYLAPEQDAILKERARLLGVSEAEVLRRAIDLQKTASLTHVRDPESWDREKRYIEERMAAGLTAKPRRFKREDAYEERLNRYGR